MSNIQTDNLNTSVPFIDPKKATIGTASGEQSTPIRAQMLSLNFDPILFNTKVPGPSEMPMIARRLLFKALSPTAVSSDIIMQYRFTWNNLKDDLNLVPYYQSNYNYIAVGVKLQVRLQSNPFFVTSLVASFNSEGRYIFDSTSPENVLINSMYNNLQHVKSLPYDIIMGYRSDVREYIIPFILPMRAIRNLTATGYDDEKHGDYNIGTFDLRHFTPVRCADPLTVTAANVDIWISGTVVYGGSNFSTG